MRLLLVLRSYRIYPTKDIINEADERGTSRGCTHRRTALPPRALVRTVVPESPADDAGFEAGCVVTSVDGHPVRDIIDWRWLAADDEINLGYIDLDGDAGEIELVREPGEEWGFEFEGVVFDGVKQCRNACIFCFMQQLPDDMRPSLTLRDDDFRLSFLSGTFVTFTNLSSEDEARIIEQHISPLRVSLHASNSDVRRHLIGRHAQHGLEVLDRLLAAGIEFHAQIVLMPDENDGAVLEETLHWAYARPGILDVCIVPLGFTKHQSKFDRSFNDPHAAYKAMERIVPIQQRALEQRGTLWAFAADEFYHNAYGATLLDNLPSADHYGDFGMFEDGVGIIRSFVDDWEQAENEGLTDRAAAVLKRTNLQVRYVAGYATRQFLGPLTARSSIAGHFEPFFVKNDFFGGNVDVTGLLCGVDIVAAIRRAEGRSLKTSENSSLCVERGSVLYVLPRVMFNDNGVTLDDMTLEDMENKAGANLAVVSCNASDFLLEIIHLAEQTFGS